MIPDAWFTGLLDRGIAVAAPIALAAMGEGVVERAGVINLGVEGMMLAGAFAGALVGLATGSPLVALAGAVVAGALAGATFAWLVLRLGLDQVVAGVAINLLMIGATAVMWRAFTAGGGVRRVPLFTPILGQQPVAWSVALLAPALWWFLHRTRTGLVLRACGEDPDAVRGIGHPVARVRLGALVFGGAMAGAAGSLLLADAASFSEEMTAGRGFVALAIVVFGGWSPVWIAAAALFFGCASSLQFTLQAARLDVSDALRGMLPAAFRALPYVLSLVALAGFAGRRRAPAGLGRP